MRKPDKVYKIYSCVFGLLLLILAGCSKESDTPSDMQPVQEAEDNMQTEDAATEELASGESLTGEMSAGEKPAKDMLSGEIPEKEVTIDEREEAVEPVMIEEDWSAYFDGINGAAVIYDPAEESYQIYNQELALTRRSPCSTFKIISSLIALEEGAIEPDDSVRTWSGEIFWNEEWNRDIGFSDAFHASCVWYFREVIDEIGKEIMQEELNRLLYGNCDISDWEGHLNTNNSNPVLTGFWIESSLLISPKEQTEVMERIFGDHTEYSEETLDQLKQVMLLQEQNEADVSIYGKTGMGKAHGIVVDSWFTGFADTDGKRIYFCVYLGETDGADVSSAKAREIAVEIVLGQNEEK